MGQTQSTPQRHRDLSTSESSLVFDSSRKPKSDDGDFNFISPNKTQPPKKDSGVPVLDDGGEGYIPSEEVQKEKKSAVPVVFHWECGGKEVYLSGSFNDWKTRVPMTYGGGEFTAIIELPIGDHQFKYYVDGKWLHDPTQKTVDDTFGGRNNLITIKESDFDVTEALLKDEYSGNVSHVSSSSSFSRLSPPGSYSQLIPTATEPLFVNNALNAVVPPSLPPHLLNVILNKDSLDDEDPTLLPVPNHVALNHLYALSIKDSVMTLSATHRYKRKYVTTIMYKPISM